METELTNNMENLKINDIDFDCNCNYYKIYGKIC